MVWKYDLLRFTSINLEDYREADLVDLRYLHGKLVKDIEASLKNG